MSRATVPTNVQEAFLNPKPSHPFERNCIAGAAISTSGQSSTGSLDDGRDPPGLAIFFLSGLALTRGLSKELTRGIEARGFEMLSSLLPTDGHRLPCGCEHSEPAVAVILFDSLPRTPSVSERVHRPGLDNGPITLTLNHLRDQPDISLVPQSDRTSLLRRRTARPHGGARAHSLTVSRWIVCESQ